MQDAAGYLRDRIIIAFYAETGCRVSELLGVTVEQIDFKGKAVLIPHLKRGIHKTCPKCGRRGGRSTYFCSRCGADMSKVEAEGIEQRSRLINLSDKLLAAIREYIKSNNLKPTDRLINLSRQQVYYIVRDLAEKAGLKGRMILNPETGKNHYVHPHNFRDALAVDWLKEEGDADGMKALQQQLGHRSFETTARYNKLNPETTRDLSEKIRKKRFG